MLGPIGIEHRSKRSSSSDLPESWVLLSVVLMVLTCHSMKPLDLRKWGKEVIWSIKLHCKNWVSLSDMKEGPLSVWSRQGGLYCKMSSCKC